MVGADPVLPDGHSGQTIRMLRAALKGRWRPILAAGTRTTNMSRFRVGLTLQPRPGWVQECMARSCARDGLL